MQYNSSIDFFVQKLSHYLSMQILKKDQINKKLYLIYHSKDIFVAFMYKTNSYSICLCKLKNTKLMKNISNLHFKRLSC